MPENMLQETLDLLRDTNLPIVRICENAGVQPRWLHRLIAGDFADPGVNKIERLNRYLKTESVDRNQ